MKRGGGRENYVDGERTRNLNEERKRMKEEKKGVRSK